MAGKKTYKEFLARLDFELKHMTYRTKVYNMIQKEMQKQGHWKNKKRANPKKGYKQMMINSEGNLIKALEKWKSKI